LGYTKIRAPDQVMKLIKEFWDANKDNQKVEAWPSGYVLLFDGGWWRLVYIIFKSKDFDSDTDLLIQL
jgi:hypothetical protein